MIRLQVIYQPRLDLWEVVKFTTSAKTTIGKVLLQVKTHGLAQEAIALLKGLK